MRDLDEIEFGPQGEGEGTGTGPRSRSPYDPLFGGWEPDPEPELSPPPAWLSRRNDDFMTWGLPEPASAGPSHAAPAPAWRAASYYTPPQTYTGPMTEAQQALQQGVVVIPRPERRWMITVREVAETAARGADLPRRARFVPELPRRGREHEPEPGERRVPDREQAELRRDST